MTVAVWVRWLLRIDYQILPDHLEWFVCGVSPVPLHRYPTVHVVPSDQAGLERMLLAGDLDVLCRSSHRDLIWTAMCGSSCRIREKPNELRR